jgi:hypothetical protein
VVLRICACNPWQAAASSGDEVKASYFLILASYSIPSDDQQFESYDARYVWASSQGHNSRRPPLHELLILQGVSGHSEGCGRVLKERNKEDGNTAKTKRTKSEAAEDGQIFLALPVIGSGAKRNS